MNRISEVDETTYLSHGITKINGISDGDKIITHKTPLTPADVSSGFDQKILVWSAADEDGIGRLAAAWSHYFSNLSIPNSQKTHFLRDLAYTLAVRRSSLPWKTFVIADPVQDLHNIVDKFAVPVRSISSPGLVFIFTGVRKYCPNLLPLAIRIFAVVNLSAPAHSLFPIPCAIGLPLVFSLFRIGFGANPLESKERSGTPWAGNFWLRILFLKVAYLAQRRTCRLWAATGI
jgi:hypothetical protein